MNKIVIIYGSPRTGTTHLYLSFISHPLCQGYNESPEALGFIQKGTHIDKLWNKTKQEILILKGSQYCFEFDAIKKIMDTNDIKLIFTDRNILEVIESMLQHPDSVAYGREDTVLLPVSGLLRKKFLMLWSLTLGLSEDKKIINRMALRYLWHVESISKEMKEKSLCLIPYELRLDSLLVFKKLNDFIDLPEDENFYKNICNFIYRHISPERKKEIKDGLLPEVLNEIRESGIDESTMDL